MEPYTQSTEYTGAASALLVALHEHDPAAWPLDKEHEFRVWHQAVTLPLRSCSIYGLATIAQKAGLTAHIIVEEAELQYPDYRFDRYKKQEVEDARLSDAIHKKEAQQAGVRIEQRSISLEEIRDHLTGGKHVLLRINAGAVRDQRPTSKYVLLTEYDGAYYHVIDPANGTEKLEEPEMREAFETLKTKKKRDNRMIVLG